MTVLAYIVVALLSVFGIAAFMEFYKKTLRGGKSANWENWLVGAALSIGVAVLDCLTGLAFPFVANMAFNILIYSVVFFLVQLFVDMKFIKKIITCAVDTMDVEKFVNIILNKLGISVDKVKSVISALGITKEQVAKALSETGFPDDEVERIINMFF